MKVFNYICDSVAFFAASFVIARQLLLLGFKAELAGVLAAVLVLVINRRVDKLIRGSN